MSLPYRFQPPRCPLPPPPAASSSNDFDLYSCIPTSQGEFTNNPPLCNPNNFNPQQIMLPSQDLPPTPNRPVNTMQNPSVSDPYKQYYKTRLCAKFSQGSCAYGSKCTFAHGRQELRLSHTNQQEIDIGKQKVIKHKFCIKFYNGEECPYRDRCIFPHLRPLGQMQNSSAAVGVKTAPNLDQNPGINVMRSYHLEGSWSAPSYGDSSMTSQRSPLWKTKICHQWEATGRCEYGVKCSFAHGYEELKKVGGYADAGSLNVAAALTSLPNLLCGDDSPCQQDLQPQTEQPKSLLKWGRPRKINGIYADWID